MKLSPKDKAHSISLGVKTNGEKGIPRLGFEQLFQGEPPIRAFSFWSS